jgi:carboxyl-terminal processing protease
MLIYRPSEDREIDVTIVRDIVEVASVKGMRMLVDGIGYVRVTQFDENAAAKLGEAIKELTEQGAESLVLDLRNNPGGLLNGAVDMCGYFLPPQTLVVSTEGRRESQKLEFRTLGQAVRFKGPLAILVNGGSASASEIVAGCLKDHERAMLVGEKTFGKGSVQNVIPLPDGSALRLTTAMYYTPKRLVIHENGIEPDIVVKITMAEQEKLQSMRMDALKNGAEMDYSLDPQLNRAVETLQSYSRFQATERRK